MRIKSVFYTESTFRISSAFKSSIFEADQNGLVVFWEHTAD